MAMGAVQRAAALLAVFKKQLLEAARRRLILGGRRSRRLHKMTTTTLGRTSKKRTAPEEHLQTATVAASTGGELWRRSILMGEKCDPVNFSGAIFYDCHGRRLSGAPPRSPRHIITGTPIKGPGLLSSPLPPPPGRHLFSQVDCGVLAS